MPHRLPLEDERRWKRPRSLGTWISCTYSFIMMETPKPSKCGARGRPFWPLLPVIPSLRSCCENGSGLEVTVQTGLSLSARARQGLARASETRTVWNLRSTRGNIVDSA